jgi:DNA-binding NarL/FixJ family response regulator
MTRPLPSAPGSESPIRIALVDDDDRVRSTLADAVDRFAGCRCAGSYASGGDALTGIPRQPPDVVLMDINMPGMNGIECVSRLKTAHPHIEVIMLTVYQDADNVLKSLAAGANGYLLKRAERDELRVAIHQVLAGGSPMSSQIARKLVQAFRQPVPAENTASRLSAREQEVLALLAKGFLYKEIAARLDIGYDTVHNYIRRIYEKLRVRSRGQAVARYFEQTNRPPTNVLNPLAASGGDDVTRC